MLLQINSLDDTQLSFVEFHLSKRRQQLNEEARRAYEARRIAERKAIPAEDLVLMYGGKNYGPQVEQDWGHFGLKSVVEIIKYVREKVFADPAFQVNPVAFLRAWKIKRGNTEELRMLEDPALRIVSAMVTRK